MPDDAKRAMRGETGMGEAARVGAELRDARESLGLGIDDVSASLKIRRVYLEAIEEGRTRDLPAPAYAIGFVRTYARALGLDDTPLVRRFRDGASGVVSRRADLVFPEPVPERGVPAGAVVLLGAVLAVGGYVGWYQWSARQGRTVDAVPPVPARLDPTPPASLSPGPSPGPGAPPLAAAAPAPAVAPGAGPVIVTAPVAPAASAPPVAPQPAPATPPRNPDEGRITLRAVRGDSWVQLRERGGTVLTNRTLRSGETLNVPPREGVLLSTGNAGALDILVDGQPAPGFAPGGGVRRDVVLDADRLKTTAVPAPTPPRPRPVEPAAPPPQ